MAVTSDQIVGALRQVYDPCCAERGISVVDMGLLQRVEVSGEGDDVRVALVLTSGWCPFVVDLLDTVQRHVETVAGVARAQVDVVWDEAWSADRMSPSARQALRFLPHPRDINGAQPTVPLPRASTEEVAS